MQALEEFKKGTMNVLVATDIAARGLDIEQLPFVINYELPHTPEDYVHRIGRTGRAGTPGEAISLVSPDEMEFLADIEKLLKQKLPRQTASGYEHEGTDRDRDRGARRHQSGFQSEPAPASRETVRAAPPAKAPAGGSTFDFSKPYEPAVKDGAAPAPQHAPLAHRRQPARPTAALLGGLPARQKSEK